MGAEVTMIIESKRIESGRGGAAGSRGSLFPLRQEHLVGEKKLVLQPQISYVSLPPKKYT
jgi:hypothetical protein